MLISIIIPVQDDARVRQCIETILEQTLKRELFEIIVVDNASKRLDVAALLRDLPITLLHEKQPGMSKAVNLGLKYATGNFLVRIDADCMATTNWLKELLIPFDDPAVGVVGGAIYNVPGRNIVEIGARDLVIGNQLEPQYLPMFEAPYVVTANSAYRTDVVRQIGGFDETFVSGSDVDISWQCFLAGYQLRIAPQAVVHHYSRSTVRKYFLQFYRYGLGHAQLYKKYRKTTGSKFLVNSYPFKGLARLMSFGLLGMVRWISNPQKFRIYCTRLLLDFAEYSALICGDLVGAIRYRIPYL